MDSEHSKYSELYERCSESRIKSEDIYGQESNNTEEKKSHSPNSELDNPNLNIEVQQNIIQNSNGNGQAPNNNSPLHSNNNNTQPLNNISLQVHNEENAIFSLMVLIKIVMIRMLYLIKIKMANLLMINSLIRLKLNLLIIIIISLLISSPKIIIIAMINTKKSIQLTNI